MTMMSSRDKLVNSKFKSSVVKEIKLRKSSNVSPVRVDSKIPGTTVKIICERSNVGIKFVFNSFRNSASANKPKISKDCPGSG